MAVLLSPYEEAYILSGIDQGLRNDGRGLNDYRQITVETGVLSHTHGSCRLQLATTDVLVGVMAELGEPLANAPDQGRVSIAVDCPASASPAFEGRSGEAIGNEIARAMQRTLDSGGAVDLSALSIVSGKQCWVLYVDALVLAHGGNLFDAVSFAVRAALRNTRIPKVTVVEGEDGLGTDLEVDNDAEATVALDTKGVPVLVTLTMIGAKYLVDATVEEEACVLARLIVGVDSASNICMVQKGGLGGIDPASLYELLESAKRIGKAVLRALDQALDREAILKKSASAQSVGFLVSGH